jgi:hypothetical protein
MKRDSTEESLKIYCRCYKFDLFDTDSDPNISVGHVFRLRKSKFSVRYLSQISKTKSIIIY